MHSLTITIARTHKVNVSEGLWELAKMFSLTVTIARTHNVRT